MQRLFPQSLFGRLAVILFVGLLLAQFASIAIQFKDRSQRLFHASGASSSERIADIVRLLDDASRSERQRLIAILNVAPLQVSLNKPIGSTIKKTANNWPAIEFKKRLRQQLGNNYPLQVAVSDKINNSPMHGMHRSNKNSQNNALPITAKHNIQHMQNMGALLPDALIFYAQVKLHDGTWVFFENNINKEVFASSTSLLLTLAILIIAVLLISLLAVRWVTRPLTMLSNAADKLGNNINHPPIAETGPTEVRQAAKSFNAMQQRLTKFIKDRSQLLTAISHDLKTPITRMRLRAEMLDDNEQRLSFIKNLDEMQQITSETLDFLRTDDTREPLQAIDICSLLESIKEDAAELGQKLELKTCSLSPCFAQPSAIKRCIRNLTENAFKYANNVQIQTQQTSDTITISVLDSGTGIPEDKLEAVFKPFYRLETSRNRETGGTGLGLSIARNIALLHGGDLYLVNKTDGGLKAVLTLSRKNG